MAYFQKYYMEYTDFFNRLVRIDILDSQGLQPSSPYPLIGSAEPLVTEILDTKDEKEAFILGKQITINYLYDGDPNTPLPSTFFEADERRFRVEVRKDGNLYGVYFIRPDGCEEPFLYPPFPVSITAVDGLAYAEGTPFNMFNEDESLKYEKISLYEAIVTRALYLVVDDTLPINVFNSLLPTNIESGVKLLLGTFVHTDAFYDFVKGASTVKDVLEMFCMSFGCRLFLEDGAIWWQRIEDLNTNTFLINQYQDESTVVEITPNLSRSVGPSSFFDAIPTERNAFKRTTTAIKRADFKVSYDSINVIRNFDWRTWDGTNFQYWQKSSTAFTNLEQRGSGTIDDPFKAFVEYSTEQVEGIQQTTLIDESTFQKGDRVQFEIKINFINTVRVDLTIGVTRPDNLAGYLIDSGGNWRRFPDDGNTQITVTRSGKKVQGSFSLTSQPFPGYDGDYNVILIIRNIQDIFDPLDPITPGIEIFPVKVGVITISYAGRNVRVINTANFSRVKGREDFKFIDTGDDGLSNTLFTGALQEPAASWTTDKPGVADKDIERFMATAYINQAQRSVVNWEGETLAKDIGLKNVFSFSAITGKRLIIIKDSVDERTCKHQCTFQEVFEEGTSEVTYSEYDIEDTEDD